MSKVAALVRRELGVYFVSPMAYIVLTVYLLLCGVWFSGQVSAAAGIGSGGSGKFPLTFEGTFQFVTLLALLITPLVTMRLIAEERSRGTIELLMTSPVSEFQVVLAKFVGAVLFFSFLLVPTLVYVWIVHRYGSVDWGATMTGYLGLLLFISFLVSIGLFISSLTSSQMVAAVLTIVLMFALFLVSMMQGMVSRDSWLWIVLAYVNVSARAGSFAMGVIDTRDVVFLGAGTIYFLFASTLTMESRRWR